VRFFVLQMKDDLVDERANDLDGFRPVSLIV